MSEPYDYSKPGGSIAKAIDDAVLAQVLAEPSFYSCSEDVEQLNDTDPDEAIEHFLDNLDPAEWPETLKVYGWKRTRVRASSYIAQSLVEVLLDDLNEDYGDPNGDADEPTQPMLEFAATFINAVLTEYQKTSWPHEIDATFQLEVNVLEWVRENAPEWLKERGADVERIP